VVSINQISLESKDHGNNVKQNKLFPWASLSSRLLLLPTLAPGERPGSEVENKLLCTVKREKVDQGGGEVKK